MPRPGECKDIRDILITLAKSIDEEMHSFFNIKMLKSLLVNGQKISQEELTI